MLGNMSLAEGMILSIVGAALVYSGWVIMRAWDRRQTAARDLHSLADEARALAEQNALLAHELAQLADHRVPGIGLAGRILESESVPLRHPQ